MSAHEFVQAARSLKGTRWRHRGRKPWAVDCVGLVVLSARVARLPVEDVANYGREPWEDQLRRELRRHFGAPVPAPWQPGDIPLIRWRRGQPSHMAIVGDHPDGGLTLIHADNLKGVVECSLSGPFLECVLEVYRPAWGQRVD